MVKTSYSKKIAFSDNLLEISSHLGNFYNFLKNKKRSFMTKDNKGDLSNHMAYKFLHYIKRHEWPWRYRWIPIFFVGLFYNPVVCFKCLWPLIRGEMFKPAFRLQLFGREMLKDALEACKTAGFAPFLAYGTLLGYYRDHGFIKTDNDIDLGLLEKDADKLPALTAEMIKKGYIVLKRTPTELLFRKKKHHKLLIEFCIYCPHKNTSNVYHCIHSEEKDELNIHVYPENIFNKLEKARFLNFNVLIPENAEAYLVLTYGEGWKIPTPAQEAKTSYFKQDLKKIYPNMIIIAKKKLNNNDFH